MYKFSFLEYHGIFRPAIPVTLTNFADRTISGKYVCLIDSGSPSCILTYETATALGHNFGRGSKRPPVKGLTDGQLRAETHTFLLKVGMIEFKCPFNVVDDRKLSPDCRLPFGIIGQHPFFDHFDILIAQRNRTTELIPVTIHRP